MRRPLRRLISRRTVQYGQAQGKEGETAASPAPRAWQGCRSVSYTHLLQPKGLKVGDTVESGPEADIKPGNALPLANIPVGMLVHAVEFQPGKGAAMARSAGTSIQLMGKEGGYAILRMPSSEMRRVLLDCRATVGEVGNAEHSNIRIGKAGRKRWMGVRPTVRGTVMNPGDHPHGGGEGKNKSAGRHPVTPWGIPTKGHRTQMCIRDSRHHVLLGQGRQVLPHPDHRHPGSR